MSRFQSEAATLAALIHPNIAHVYSVEVDRDGDREVRFLTMELVGGERLDEIIGDEGLPLERVLDLAIPLTDALAEAHWRGIGGASVRSQVSVWSCLLEDYYPGNS